MFLCLFIPHALVLFQFLFFTFSGKNLLPGTLFRIVEVLVIVVYPFLFLGITDSGKANDCCNDEVFFSPEHRLTIYSLIIICAAAYFYSTYRKSIAPPILEVTINCLLWGGMAINVFIAIQSQEVLFWLAGNGAIILLFISVIIKNQRMVLTHLESYEASRRSIAQKICWKLLLLNPFIKNPILILLCLPLLFIVTGILLIFGQKPDSLIRAFTDTYKHGFSQLNSECDNVECGGHYLCSVAANGHKKFVKPQRLGERGGRKVICNRQLLVSNAFEELLQERLPFIHKRVRQTYNHVGNAVHRYYGIFNNKYVADVVYILMKPLEWFFVIVLYTFDSKPENRIAKQYLSKTHRVELKMLNN